MPPNINEQLLNGIQDAIQESGYSGVLISPPRTHPRKYAITGQNGSVINVWIYIWTLTPGGRPQLPNEYRIQMTTVVSPLPLNPLGLTILLGYEPDLNMFAGFDLRRHRTFTTGSPSVQVDIRSIRQALQDGFAFDRKSNGEITVGIRPDQLVPYILDSESLHRGGANRANFNLLERAATLEPISLENIENLSTERQRVILMVSKLSRSTNFRKQILHAYGFRCAVTRAQLKLLDAAHILPVGAPGSVDDVRNGLALSPTYHRAYDRGLIYLNGSYEMRINPEKEQELIAANRSGGLEAFRSALGRIALPPDRRQWPNPDFIARANVFRSIPRQS